MNSNSLSFDLHKLWFSHQGKNYSLKKEPLAKSLGIKGDGSTTVIDCTCGTAKDSILLLKFGAKVKAYERNETVYNALKTALDNALKVDDEFSQILKNRFTLTFGEAKNFEVKDTDVIYMDPMYPDNGRKKKALPRLEMQKFHEIVGLDEDQDELFKWAISTKAKRIVVKRPLHAPTYDKLIHSYVGKSTRYDLYSGPN